MVYVCVGPIVWVWLSGCILLAKNRVLGQVVLVSKAEAAVYVSGACVYMLGLHAWATLYVEREAVGWALATHTSLPITAFFVQYPLDGVGRWRPTSISHISSLGKS